MLRKAKKDLTKARAYVKKLLPRHQPKSILKNGGGSTSTQQTAASKKRGGKADRRNSSGLHR